MLLSIASATVSAQEEPLPAPPPDAPMPPQPPVQASPPPVIVAVPTPEPGPVVILAPAPSPRNGIHINPIAIALGVFGVGYERVLGHHAAIRFEAQYTRFWFSGDTPWGVGASIRPSFFFFRPAPGGMYLSPFVSVAYAEASNSMAAARGVGWSAGATIGYSWVFARCINLRAGAGVQYMSMEVSGESLGEGRTASVRMGMKSVLPALDLSLGFVF